VWAPGIPDPQPRVSSDVWDWLCSEETEDTDPPDERKDVLARLLQSECEPERLRAAYDLAALGEEGIAVLISTLREQSLATIEVTTAQTPDNAHGTNPTPTPAALALSSVGKQAVRPVIQLLGDEDWWVRSVAANVLCRIGTEAKVAIPDLVKASRDAHWWVRRNAIEALTEIGESVDVTAAVRDGLGDEDYRVRRSACLSVVRFGPAAVQTVADLAPVLEDENRYNRFYAALALRRIGTPEATVLLLDDLFTSRWCPITTKDDRF
jgi:HEAT repeat protein